MKPLTLVVVSVLMVVRLASGRCPGDNSIVARHRVPHPGIRIASERFFDLEREAVPVQHGIPFGSSLRVRSRSGAASGRLIVFQDSLTHRLFRSGDRIRLEYFVSGTATHQPRVRLASGKTQWFGPKLFLDTEQWCRCSYTVSFDKADTLKGVEVLIGGGAVDAYIGGLNAYLVKKDISVSALPWEIEAGDINDDGITEIVMGSLAEDSVYCVASTGRRLWREYTGGIVRDIAIGELSPADEGCEVAVICGDANHTLRVYSAGGRELWTWKHQRVFSSVAIGDVDGDSANEVVCAGGGTDIQVFSGSSPHGRGILERTIRTAYPHFAKVACGRVMSRSRENIVVPLGFSDNVGVFDALSGDNRRPNSKAKTSPLCTTLDPGNRRTRMNIAVTVCLADLDQDSANEILGGGAIDYAEFAAFDCNRADEKPKLLWRYAPPRRPRWLYPLSIPMSGDLNGDGIPEIITFSWVDPNSFYPRTSEPAIKVFSTSGEEHKFIHPRFAFSCATVQQGITNDFLLLGSDFDDPDHRVFLLSGAPDTALSETLRDVEQYVLELEHAAFPVTKDHLALRNSVDRIPARKDTSTSEKYFILLPRFLLQYGYKGSKSAKNCYEATYKYCKEVLDHFSTGNVEASMVWENYRELSGSLPKSKKCAMPRDSVLAKLERLEKHRIPFWIEYSHVDRRHFTLRCIDAIIEKAPTMLRGFMVLEYGNAFRSRQWPALVRDLKSLAKTSRQHGLKIVLCGGGKSFMRTFADTAKATGLNWMLDTSYKDVFVPMLKLNNHRTVDKSLAEVIGLWKAGYVSDIGYSTQQDNWDWQWYGPIAAVPSGVLLRQEISAVACGARYLRVEGAQPYFTGFHFLDSADTVGGRLVHWEAGTQYHRGLVYDLISKGIVQPIAPDQLVNVSRAGFLHADPNMGQIRKVDEKLLEHQWFLGSGHNLGRIRPHNASAVVSGVRRTHAETLFPPNPFGLWTIVPDTNYVHKLTCADTMFYTDGRCVWDADSGKWDSAWEAKGRIQTAFANAAGSLPFVCDSCLMFVHDLGDRYRLYILDTDYYFADDDTCVVSVQTALSEGLKSGTDVISGNTFGIVNGRMTVPVPAGLFRIIELGKLQSR